MRLKTSFGIKHYNPGCELLIDSGKYKVDYSRRFYLFDVIPMGAVRMTKSDKWKTNPLHPDPKKRQRKAVADYFAFKNSIRLQASVLKFQLGKCFEAIYFIPMPNSWSEKKKERMNGLPCEVKPDLDNITKAVKDALKTNDSDVWFECAQKRWAYRGSILIYQ